MFKVLQFLIVSVKKQALNREQISRKSVEIENKSVESRSKSDLLELKRKLH